jgi:membrane protease YdiL (CAAX protease family)
MSAPPNTGPHYPPLAAPAQGPRRFAPKMGKMDTPSEHVSLLGRAERYWAESRRPLTSLAFIAPLLVVYEVGVLCWRVRPNGADDFMRRLLDLFGFGQHFLLPGLIVAILLGWHYLSRQPWKLSGGVLSAMAVEAVLLGLWLRAIVFFQNSLALDIGEVVERMKNGFLNAVGFLGAGIYEELLFRLILLSLLAWAFRRAGATPRVSMIAAVLLSSLLFAAAHHVGPYGEWPIRWSRFIFRMVAGIFFSLVYVYRGFGIAAGSHAAYDILVGAL